MTKVAVLDDYQGVALDLADWSGLDVEAFADHVAGDDAVVERLAPFEVVVAMRERTPFTRALLERLPSLRLLVTTGMRERVDRPGGGARARHHGVRHRLARTADRRAGLGADPRR